MFRFTPYVIKSLWRHRARTLLTVSGAAVALFVLCFVGSVQEGLERLTEDEHAQRTLIVFQENRFCPTSSRLPQDYADRIRKMPGVKDVMPVLVWTNSCRSILDAVVFNGAPAQKLRSARDLRLSSGNWGEFTSRHDAALVGRNVAQRRKLTVGDQFSIGEISVKVAGVFGSSIAAEDNLIYTNLEFLQYTRGLNAAGLVTQHEVHLTDDAEPDALARAIDEALRAGPVATTTRRKGAFQTSTLSDLVDLIGFAHWLGYACVALVLYVLGKFFRAGVGHWIWKWFEGVINRLPVIRNVYSSVKQVTDFFFSEQQIGFNRVVAIEYPRQGLWAIAFVTGEGMLDVRSATNEPMLSVLVPTSPIPGTGFTVMVRQRDALDLNMTVDQAVQYLVSCGVVVPFVQQSRVGNGNWQGAEVAADPRRRLSQPLPSGSLD
jgi:putative ABC transport system permease protein